MLELYGVFDYVDNGLELDITAKLSKGKTINGDITTLLMSPGKKLEFVYENFAMENSITFTGKN